MNKWECNKPNCNEFVIGTGGAIGLRAIGWQVIFGSFTPFIRCPRHRNDPISPSETEYASYHLDETSSAPCSICRAEKEAKRLQIVIEAQPNNG